MSKNKSGLVKTPLDDLTYKVNGLAMQVQRELKSGHKEVFYQRRLKELCLEAGLEVDMEKRVEVWIGDSMVGYLYLDLWVEQSLVVECKTLNHDLTNDELSQTLVYLAATGAPVGMLYNFGRTSLEYRRILRPTNMQEWQKYLYRVVWTLPGTTLPLDGSPEFTQPIRFSIVSPLANQLAVLESKEVSTSQSVGIRESAKESVLESTPIRESVKESVLESAYENSGVSIAAGNQSVDLMKDAVRSTYTPSVLAGIGSFGGLYDASVLKVFNNPVLVASTDGVGTKVKLAAQAGRYRSIGHDIVNHCINDILVQGARPLFFMDYFATSKLTPEVSAEVVTGIAEACKESGMALLGGETAEMPGVYQPNEFDVAGTIVGVVERDNILPRKNLKAGDVLIGLTSSGPHTNGYSLIRKIFADTPLDTILPELDISLADALLASHRSYYSVIYSVLSEVKALAHLTGGGFIENIPRIMPDDLDAVIRLDAWTPPPLWKRIQSEGHIATGEMYRVFNMGIGMVIIVDKRKAAEVQKLISEPTFIIGELVKGKKKVRLVS
ncbi:MAG: phosphoribosylformylglycinamidine cyclo-ligase [Chloroflexi bacterium]|nr:phosphoribosylformylglycinamidine cyclo-ligase [Chloroflexota bacterium]MBI3339475.1 phosphoribosylformylglycinamidine cyclo-ligase [Chloroflexota bacterium]